MSSNAVTLDRISRIVGYKITKGNFNLTSPNLPQRIALFGEANTANQSALVLTPQQITTQSQAGSLFGFGSPIHIMSRILFPVNGNGVGGIPVFVYPQAQALGATPTIFKILPTGVATANVTHYVKIAGRESIDGTYYQVNIVVGDVTSTIIAKILAAINAVLSSPFSANTDAYEAILTSKWNGLTAAGLTVSMDTNGNAAGLTYSVLNVQTGTGIPSVSAALNQFGTDWNTIVCDPYGTELTHMAAMMAFNGIPDPNNPTGRYVGIIMKPFIAITGSIADDPSSVTSLTPNDVTFTIAPAPGSLALPMEAAANATLLHAVQAQNAPHLGIQGQAYPDMPVSPTWSSASMALYTNRDAIVKRGCSTVMVNAGVYVVQDFVTTYNPPGEVPPQFQYVRDLNVDFNVRYTYYLLELTNCIDHVICNDGDNVTATNVIKPKIWKGILFGMADDLANRALIANPSFTKSSIVVNIGTTNPDRFETFFKYQRTGVVIISSTTAQAGFNYGALTS